MTDATPNTLAASIPQHPRVGPAGMWTFLATDAMGFGGLFIAYAVLRVRADTWPAPREHLELGAAALMTLALLASAFTMTMAAGAGVSRARFAWLGATVGLGVAFLYGGVVEYRHLWTSAVPLRLGSDPYASTFYALTGYHGLHVAVGLLALLGLAVRGARPKSLEVVALYWHFVDLAWMPIFTFVYLMPTR
jgi:heme/copper-type cytochrome/quinol oxidase subunit 3